MPAVAGEEQKPYLMVETEEIKKVAEYTGLNFAEVTDLDCYTFRLLFKDAYIYDYKKTERGREYLEDCYICTLTQPDRKALRARYGGEQHGDD